MLLLLYVPAGCGHGAGIRQHAAGMAAEHTRSMPACTQRKPESSMRCDNASVSTLTDRAGCYGSCLETIAGRGAAIRNLYARPGRSCCLADVRAGRAVIPIVPAVEAALLTRERPAPVKTPPGPCDAGPLAGEPSCAVAVVHITGCAVWVCHLVGAGHHVEGAALAVPHKQV